MARKPIGLIGRDNEIQDVLEKVDTYNPKNLDTKLLYFHGKPGVGKTALKRELERIIHSEREDIQIISMDFEEKKYCEEFPFVFQLYLTLSKTYPIEFSYCDAARFCYQEKFPNDPLVSTHTHTENEVMHSLMELAMTIKAVSIFDKVRRVIGSFVAQADGRRDLAELSDIAEMDAQELQKRFPEFLIKDLEAHCGFHDQKLIILLDTYEKVNEDFLLRNQNWVLNNLIWPSSGVFWIVLGTQPDAFINAGLPQNIYSRYDEYKLLGLEEEDATIFLKKSGVRQQELIELMLAQSFGNPAALTVYAESYCQMVARLETPTREDFLYSDPDAPLYTKTYEIYKRHLEETEIVLISALSEFDNWDEGIYDAVSYAVNCSVQYEMFIKHCIVEEIPPKFHGEQPSYRIIDVAKEYFRHLNTEKDRVRIYHAAFDHFQTCVDAFYPLVENMRRQNIFSDFAFKAVDCGLKWAFYSDDDLPVFMNWFVRIEQSLSPVRLYYLKVALLNRVLTVYGSPKSIRSDCQEALLQCWYDLTWGYYFLKDYRQARDCGFESLLYSHRLYPLSDEHIAKNMYAIGNAVQYMGNYDDSIWWQERALEFRQRRGNDHCIGISLNSLACTYMNLFEMDGRDEHCCRAEQLFLQAIAVRQKLLDDPEREKKAVYASLHKTYGNLSKLYFLAGKYENACAKLEEAHRYLVLAQGELADKIYDGDEIRIRRDILNVKTRGEKVFPDVQQELRCFQAAYAREERPDISSITLNNIAVLEALYGDLRKAEEMFLTSLQEKLEYFKEDRNKNVVVTRKNLNIVQNLLYGRSSAEALSKLHFEY